MRDEILSGKVLQANDSFNFNRRQVEPWHDQRQMNHPTLDKIIQDEVELVLRKLGFYGWTHASSEQSRTSGKSHISSKSLQHVSSTMFLPGTLEYLPVGSGSNSTRRKMNKPSPDMITF